MLMNNYVLNCTPSTQRKLETGMTFSSYLLLCFCGFLHRIYQSTVYIVFPSWWHLLIYCREFSKIVTIDN
jgi:hypothetical protein